MSNALENWGDFPRVGLIVNGEKQFLCLFEAIPTWDSGWASVESTGEVLEADFSVRPMTTEENRAFQDRVDEFSASK